MSNSGERQYAMAPTQRKFAYHAQTTLGAWANGTIEAPSADAAHDLLTDMRLRGVELSEPKPAAVPTTTASPPVDATPPPSGAAWQSQPLAQALSLLAAAERYGRRASALRRLARTLRQGRSLEIAWAQERRVFPVQHRRLLDAALARGRLARVLQELGEHRALRWRRRLMCIDLIGYPLLGWGAVSVVALLILSYVVPHLRDTFDVSAMTYPSIALFQAADALPGPLAMQLKLLGPAVLVLLLCHPWWGELTDLCLLGVPGLGPRLRAGRNILFCDALSLATAAGLGLIEAIPEACAALKSSQARRDGACLVAALKAGRPLERLEALRVLDAGTLAALNLAWSSSHWSARPAPADDALATSLRQLAVQRQRAAEASLAAVNSIFMVLVILTIGAMLVFTVVALFLPLGRLTEMLMR